MSNIHGLYTNKKKNNKTNKRINDNDDDDDDDDDDDVDESNNRYVGGIGDRGGGSGLAVQPNTNDLFDSSNTNPGAASMFLGGRDAIFGRAEDASTIDSTSEGTSREQVRRVITMYRDGFIVDDGPYRRLNDPANADFLRSMAMGRIPRELAEETAATASANASTEGGTGTGGGGGGMDVVVGLVDKRNEDYVEVFQSFSGQGLSLGGGTGTLLSPAALSGVFDPEQIRSEIQNGVADDDNMVTTTEPTTSVAVRLLNGSRKVIKISLQATVKQLALRLVKEAFNADEKSKFRLVSGYPPIPLEDETVTIETAGLKGAQISMHKV